MTRIATTLRTQQTEAERLDAAIAAVSFRRRLY